MRTIPEFKFCPVCGGRLKSAVLKSREPARLVCSACGFVFYLDPKLVALSVVEMEGRILLLRRSNAPGRGKWALPGGFVDRDEEVGAAAVRETAEECGVQTRVKELLGVYSYPGELVVIIAYVAEHLSGEPISGDETEEARLTRPEEIPWDGLAFQSTKDALRDYCRLRDVGGI
jgi:ADP-ribose pyrophosphatase YjhB (NUDIX family)